MLKFAAATCAALLAAPLWAQSIPSGDISSVATTSGDSAKAISVALEEAGFAGAFAVSDADGGVTIRPAEEIPASAAWPWASVTKQVLAVLTLQHVESGETELDARTNAYLPALGADPAAPTIRELLQHRSGLRNPDDSRPDVNGIPSFYSDGPSGLDWCLDERGASRAEGWRYNNCDYIVLGAVLEAISGKPLETLLQERVFAPAGMVGTRLARADTASAGVVGQDAAITERAARYGASAGLIGPLSDLIAFDRALLQSVLIGPQSLQLLMQGEPDLGYMSLGQWSFPASLAGCEKPVQLIERRGAIADFHIQNYIVPGRGIALAAITRQADFDFGEIWTGSGASHAALSAWLCESETTNG